MKLRSLAAVLLISVVLSGCNTISYSKVPSAVPGQQVRVATLQDPEGNVVGRSYELYDPQTMAWYEAQPSPTGVWQLTTAGRAAQQQANSGGGDNGGGGGC